MNGKSHTGLLVCCWLLLILATLATVYWGTRLAIPGLQLAVILVIAIIKAGLIIDGFMELRHAAPGWRVIMYGWPLAMALIIALTLWFARGG